MTEKQHKYPLITVKWADHFFCEEDMTLSEIQDTNKEPLIGVYSGFLVDENQRMMAIASNIWEDDHEASISPTMYIMKRAIVYRSDRDDTID